MNEDEHERQFKDGGEMRRVGETPGESCEEQEEREEMREGRVRSVPGVFRFWSVSLSCACV